MVLSKGSRPLQSSGATSYHPGTLHRVPPSCPRASVYPSVLQEAGVQWHESSFCSDPSGDTDRKQLKPGLQSQTPPDWLPATEARQARALPRLMGLARCPARGAGPWAAGTDVGRAECSKNPAFRENFGVLHKQLPLPSESEFPSSLISGPPCGSLSGPLLKGGPGVGFPVLSPDGRGALPALGQHFLPD